MPDYSKGKIYKILNNIDDEIYVGSTVETLSHRMAKHRCDMKRKHCILYQYMLKLGVSNFYIELIENYPCNDLYELRAREGHYIRERGTLNMVIAGRTSKEWYDELISQRKKEHRQTNLEEVRSRDREYRTNNIERARDTDREGYASNEYRNQSVKQRVKQWRQDNQ